MSPLTLVLAVGTALLGLGLAFWALTGSHIGRPKDRRTLRFLYRDDDGATTEKGVVDWRQDTFHFHGYCLDTRAVHTFKFSRVTQWLSGTERMLRSPYPAPMPAKRLTQADAPEILFTGFGPLELEDLQDRAWALGLQVQSHVTRRLTYLCTGKNPDADTILAAKESVSIRLTKDDFLRIVNRQAA